MIRDLYTSSLLAAVCLSTTIAWSEPPERGDVADAVEIKQSDEGTDLQIIDEFDGKLTLDWQTLRPDPSHYSLTKHPGELAITTQYGSMHLRRDRPLTKNLFLLDNPLMQQRGFVAAACLESFAPTTVWQQAGLIVFDDEDNYLKFVLEFNNRTEHAAGVGPIWNLLREVDGQSTITKALIEGEVKRRLWLRLTVRGNHYEYATSDDGETFTVHGELPWGDGSPKRIGLMATNGGSLTADEIDAQFDRFEVRSLTPEEKDEPRFVERQRLVGTWKVTSCELAGKPFENASLSRFVFTETSVTVEEKDKSLEGDYTLDVSKDPKQLALSAFLGLSSGQVMAPTPSKAMTS